MLLFSLRPFTEVAQEMFSQMRGHARYIKSQLQRTDSLIVNFFLCFLRNLPCCLKLPDKSNHLSEDSKPDKLCIGQSFVLFMPYDHIFCFSFQVSFTSKSLKSYNLLFTILIINKNSNFCFIHKEHYGSRKAKLLD